MALPRFLTACDRALGQVDLNPLSPTYGCSDRGYWHYQDSKAFSVGSCLNAMISFLGAQGLCPERKQIFKEAVSAQLSWWSSCVLSKGSIDEYFPNQRSFCALAHTTLAAAFVLRSFKESNVTYVRQVDTALRRAIDLLMADTDRPDSANQSIAAMIAYDIAVEDLRLCPGRDKNPFVPDYNARECSYSEYGAFDLGYTLLSLDLLVLGSLSRRQPALKERYEEMIKNILRSLKRYVLDYTFTPEQGSRQNAHKLLGGLHCLVGEGQKVAIDLLKALEDARQYPNLVDELRCDDKYHTFFHLTSLLLTVLAKRKLPLIAHNELKIDLDVSADQSSAELLQGERFILINHKSVRCSISLLQGGLVCVQDDHDKRVSGYPVIVSREPETFYISSTACCRLVQSNGNEINIILDLYGERYVGLRPLQRGVLFSVLLRILLSTPFVTSLARWFIYNRKNENKEAILIGQRRIRCGDSVIIEEELLGGCLLHYHLIGWSRTDGHATRLVADQASFFCSPRQ